MSVYALKLALVCCLSICSAAFLSRNLFFSDVGKKIVAVWILALPLVFLLRNEAFTLLAALIILFLINRTNKPIIALVFFIVSLGAVPDWVQHYLSLPGINHLLGFTYDRVAIIAILLPIFLSIGSVNRVSWNTTDTLVCLFILLMTLLTFRDGKITTVMRFIVDSFLIYIIPYFVFSRVVRSVNDLHYCAAAFLMLAILITAILFISQIMQLNIYDSFNPRNRYFFIREYQGVFLRLSGGLSAVLVGFILLAGYFSWESIKRFGFINKFLSWAMLFAFAVGLFATGSRGGLFGVVLGVSVYYYFAKFSGPQRTLSAIFIFFLLIFEFVFGLSSIFTYEDQYGTFDYRYELYAASWEFLKQYPLFGHHSFIDTGFFNHLITGLGIIDIVSAYLEIGLKYGFAGLLLYVGIFLSVLIPLGLKLIRCKDFESDYAKYLAMYFTLLFVVLFMIGTTSVVSYFPAFIMITLGIGRSLCDSHVFLTQDSQRVTA